MKQLTITVYEFSDLDRLVQQTLISEACMNGMDQYTATLSCQTKYYTKVGKIIGSRVSLENEAIRQNMRGLTAS